MKLLISVFGDFSNNDGTTVRAKRVIELLKNDFQITTVAFASKKVNDSNIKVIKLPINSRQVVKLPFWWIGLFRAIMKERIDIIYCANDWYGFLPCYFYSKLRPSCKIIFEAHGILSEEYEGIDRKALARFARVLEKIVVQRSLTVITLSNRIHNFYKRLNSNLNLIPLFVNTSKLKRDYKKREYWREAYDLKGYKSVGIIGPFDSERNIHSLEFVQNNSNLFNKKIKFVVIGNGSFPSLHKNIVYVGYCADYVGILSALDAVIVATNISSSGPLNKIIEPMACGLPVFSTSFGVVGLDYAKHYNNIIISEENELVQEINACLFNEKLMSDISISATNTVAFHHSLLVNGNMLIKIIKNAGKRAQYEV